MSRPTEERKDRVVKIRISEEMYEDLVMMGSNLSETIRNILKNVSETGFVPQKESNSVPQNTLKEKTGDNFVPQNSDIEGDIVPQNLKAVMMDIEEMALCFGITLEEMAGQFCEMLNDGSLVVEGGVLQSAGEEWVMRFKETCHDMCVPVDKAAESAIKALRKGQI